MTKKEREEAEMIIYQVMDILDPSKSNSEFYKEKFANMSDVQFIKHFKSKFPLKFQTKPFEIEPTMDQIISALDFINVPLTERIYMPFHYKDKQGRPAMSEECLVVYTHIKKMKQFVTKKNSMSTDIDKRDMRTGLLLDEDKNGKTSDREFESLIIQGLPNTAKEMSRPKADAMVQKSEMNNAINLLGKVSLNDLHPENDEVLSKNMLDAYFLGAQLKTNLITDDDYLNATLKDKSRKVKRETE